MATVPSNRPAETAAVIDLEGKSIDSSLRPLVALVALSGVAWLLVASLLSLISAYKLQAPSFLGDLEWLTYGRVEGARTTAWIYGWGFNSAFAMALWLVCRLSKSVVVGSPVGVVAALFWNFGVTLGVVGILAGHGTVYAWLDFPAYVGPILFVAFVGFAVTLGLSFKAGVSKFVYISQWFILGATCWFAWLLSSSLLGLFADPARGTVQSLIQVWFQEGTLRLWFGSVALAALYYFLPKLSGRPIPYYYLSVYSFWVLAAVGGWAGVSHLVGGPVPAWVVSASVAANLFLVVPVLVVGLNLVPLLGRGTDYAGKYFTVGAISFLVVTLLQFLVSLRGVAEVVQFSLVGVGIRDLAFYGFYSLVAFGSLYYLAPRVFGFAWPSSVLAKVHFWSAAVGILVASASLLIGGYAQGVALNTLKGPDAAPVAVLDIAAQLQGPLFFYSAAIIVMTVGHFAFALNLVLLVSKCLQGVPASKVDAGYGVEAVAR